MLQNLAYKEKGSMFFYIMLAVALFGALAFMITRSMKGRNTDVMSKQEINVVVSEILDNAQKISYGVDRIVRNGASEGDICFIHPQNNAILNLAYNANTECADNSARLYHETGGNVVYRKIPHEWLDNDTFPPGSTGHGEWIFTNQNAVQGLGAGALNVTTSLELIAHINYLKRDICEAINKRLGITGIPATAGTFAPLNPATQGFTTATGQLAVAALNGVRTGCFEYNTGTPTYIFYHVLLERD